jgi:hypothetical protein
MPLFQELWPRTPTHPSLARVLLQLYLHPLNVRKLSLAVRESGSAEGGGYESIASGTDFAYPRRSEQLYLLDNSRRRMKTHVGRHTI